VKARKDADSAAEPARPAPAAGSTANSILEAALKIFARDGFDGASMPAIAKAASIGHPLIHYHFGSKDKLWKAAVEYAFGALGRDIAAVEEATAGLTPIDTLRLLGRGFARFCARHPQHTLIILNEVRSGGERFDWLVERYLRPLHARLDRVVEAAVAAGHIRPVPVAHLASIFVGATAHFFGAAPLMARLYDVDVQNEDVIEAQTHWVLEVLLHGLVVESPTPQRKRS